MKALEFTSCFAACGCRQFRPGTAGQSEWCKIFKAVFAVFAHGGIANVSILTHLYDMSTVLHLLV